MWCKDVNSGLPIMKSREAVWTSANLTNSARYTRSPVQIEHSRALCVKLVK